MLAAHQAGEYVHPEDWRTYLPRQVLGFGDQPPEFRGQLTAQELADLDELLAVDARVNAHLVNQQAAEALQWGDITGAMQALDHASRPDLPAWRGPFPPSAPERSRPSGLVPVPTSGRRPSRASFASLADGAQARAALRAFPLDNTGARRVNTLRMQVGVAARLQCAKLDPEAFDCLMVTLTYRGTNEDWKARHVADFMKHVRRWCQARGHGCHYVWVAELQKRGTIHYHVALWMPKGVHLPKPDQCGWWPHGMTRIEVARAAVPYLLKYLSKGSTPGGGELPKGARIYGMGGLEHVERRTRRWLGLPAFVQARSDIHDRWVRAEGGGWLAPTPRDGGPPQRFASEFVMVKVAGVRCLMRVADHGADWRPDGPFTWLHRGPSPEVLQ